MKYLISIFFFFLIKHQVISKENIDNLKLKIGESYTPSTYVIDSKSNTSDCYRMIYYTKRGVFSTAQSITVDNNTGKITANKLGLHEVVARCYGQDKKRISRTFTVSVEYPKVKEIKVALNIDKVYTGKYLPISYALIAEMGFVRHDVIFALTSYVGIL